MMCKHEHVHVQRDNYTWHVNPVNMHIYSVHWHTGYALLCTIIQVQCSKFTEERTILR